MNLPKDHQAFFDRMLPVIQSDLRFVGLAAAGSWITGTMDQFSDLDFVIAVEELKHEEVMAARISIAESLGTLLAAFTGEHVGEPRLLICLYDQPLLHVDLKFVTRTDFRKRIENPFILWERGNALSEIMSASLPEHPMPDLQWIEDRFWVWLHYAAQRLGRGELFEVMDFLSFLRQVVLGPLSLVSHQQLPRGVRRLESLAPKHLVEFKATIPAYDRESCVAAIRASVEFYRNLRRERCTPSLLLRETAELAAVQYFEEVALNRSEGDRTFSS